MTADASPADDAPGLLVFGGGWLGRAAAREAVRRGGRAVLTSRDADRRETLAAEGFGALDPDDAGALDRAVAAASTILITAPPEPDGCPGLKRLIPAVTRTGAFPDWIGYVSSTAVYGDRGGGPLAAATTQNGRMFRCRLYAIVPTLAPRRRPTPVRIGARTMPSAAW